MRGFVQDALALDRCAEFPDPCQSTPYPCDWAASNATSSITRPLLWTGAPVDQWRMSEIFVGNISQAPFHHLRGFCC